MQSGYSLRDNEGSISNILRLDTITPGSFLITTIIVALKEENSDPVLTVKRTEWRKFIDYFCQSIEADPSRVGKRGVYSVYIGYIISSSYVNLHIARHQHGK